MVITACRFLSLTFLTIAASHYRQSEIGSTLFVRYLRN
jgi:hypothetical protein